MDLFPFILEFKYWRDLRLVVGAVDTVVAAVIKRGTVSWSPVNLTRG